MDDEDRMAFPPLDGDRIAQRARAVATLADGLERLGGPALHPVAEVAPDIAATQVADDANGVADPSVDVQAVAVDAPAKPTRKRKS